MFFKIICAGIAAVLVLSGVAWAAPTYTIWASVADGYTPNNLWDPTQQLVLGTDYTLSGTGPNTALNVDGIAGVYWIDLFATLDNPDAGKGFGAVSFNLSLSGDVASNNSLPGYWPSYYGSQQEDSNGPGPSGLVPRWDINSDVGVDHQDLQNIVIANSLSSSAGDTRRTLGVGGVLSVHPRPDIAAMDAANSMPLRHYIGSIFLDYDPCTLTSTASADITATANVDLTTLALGTDSGTSVKVGFTINFTPLGGASGGASQCFPIVTGKSPPTPFFNTPTRRWYDPPLANRYDLTMTDDSLFTLAGLPVGFGDNLEIVVGNLSLGFFGAGTQVDFVTLLGYGVDSFTVQGIDPPIDLEAGGFPIYLVFNTETASFTMTPVPEPASVTLLSLGGAVMLRRRRA